MTVKILCSLCAGEIEGQVVKVAAYSKSVSTDEGRFLKEEGGTDELGTAFAHPECAERLRDGILEAFSDAADALTTTSDANGKQQDGPPAREEER